MSLSIISIFLIVLTLPVLIILFLSARHHHKVKQYLLKELHTKKDSLKKAAKILGIESIPAIGVSLFDVLYNTSKLDPFVLKGIEHLHHAHQFDNLDDVVDFMKNNIIKSEEGTRAWRDMVHKYKGYTGEEQGFDSIAHSGADIHVPESATNPDFDAIVNGDQVDFAITDHPSYVQAKLDSDPNVIVWTNREMGDAFGDNPRVVVDPDLSSQDAFHDTSDAMSGMTDLGDFIDHIPFITLAISATKNTIGVIKGNKAISTAVEHTALDTTGVGFGAFFGGKWGLALGLFFAPATGGASAIVIPTITTFIGTLMGIFSGRSITNWIKERHLRSAIKHLSSVSADFQMIFLQKYHELTSRLQNRYSLKKQRCSFARKESQSWFRRFFFPSPLAKFYSMAISRLSIEWRKTYNFYSELNNKISEVIPEQGGLILYAQGPEILIGDSSLLKEFKNVKKAIMQIEIEKRKLK